MPSERNDERLYFDTSAFQLLWRHKSISKETLAIVRTRLSAKHSPSPPVLIIGMPLLSELTPAHESSAEHMADFRPQVEFLRACRVEIPFDGIDAMRSELAGTLPFVSKEDVALLLGGVLDDKDAVRGQLEWSKARKEVWLANEKVGRDELFAAFETQKRLGSTIAREMDQVERVVDEWYRDGVRDLAPDLGIAVDDAATVEPGRIPTLRAHCAYAVTRRYLVYRDGRKLDENDSVDHQHYNAAAHATTLIIEDSKFREIAQACPAPRQRVRSFEQWVDDLQIHP
ncbi:MAG: hypothetical protein IPK60_09345 [Sandaracinaceae bacterium]|nr:hypothetical protein [Sandaracinaceae bacterium]